MKKTLKNLNRLAIGGLGLSALSTANQSLGGTNFVGQLGSGLSPMLPAVGSMYGTSMVINSTKMLRRKKR